MPYNDPHAYKDAARMAVRNALRRGELTRPSSCEMCGKEARLHAHHNDHEEPLEVNWLCVRCHSLVHHNHSGVYLPFDFKRAVFAARELVTLRVVRK